MSATDPPEPSASPPVPDQPVSERPPERPIPRGCHPLVFGVVLGTIQFAVTVYFMGWCS
jgi:hypothetical protein